MESSIASKPIDGSTNELAAKDEYGVDIEQKVVDNAYLINTTVKTFAWQGITVTVKGSKTQEPKTILDGINGIVNAGKIFYHLTILQNHHGMF